ncbi:hypothetical protein GCM10018952_45280 [Streptosporangium vulgare]
MQADRDDLAEAGDEPVPGQLVTGEFLALGAGVARASERSTGLALIEPLLSLSLTGFATHRSPDSASARPPRERFRRSTGGRSARSG